MPSHKLELSPSASRFLRKLDASTCDKIAAAIDGLIENPRPSGSRKLSGTKSNFRIRVGDYRVIYTIENKILAVFVIRIGHRIDIYRSK